MKKYSRVNSVRPIMVKALRTGAAPAITYGQNQVSWFVSLVLSPYMNFLSFFLSSFLENIASRAQCQPLVPLGSQDSIYMVVVLGEL